MCNSKNFVTQVTLSIHRIILSIFEYYYIIENENSLNSFNSVKPFKKKDLHGKPWLKMTLFLQKNEED